MNDRQKNALPPQKAAPSRLGQVCRELRWTDVDYTQFQFEQAHAYLAAYLKGDEYSVSVMERRRIFWNWWKNHWNLRDGAFIEFAANAAFNVDDMRVFYTDIHDGETLAAEIYPNGVVLTESYANMVDELIKQETATV
ncbi:MAG: hypothetical protein HOP30_11195 [Cyclobacteriaceae bacterium]|nr:hypothetical protein [Cyclobacteriaceae bacterium]